MLTSKLSSKDVDQIVFVTNEHIMARMLLISHFTHEKRHVWNVFNIKNGTLVAQVDEMTHPWSTINKDKSRFELACLDYSNVDEMSERLIVMQSCTDRSED